MTIMMVRAVRARIANDTPVLLLMVVRVMVLVVTMVVLRVSRC